MPTVDVVTVPDFDGPAAARFELRALLFLGSWLQHEGRSRAWAVHLACIGEPPASVQRMAERAGARITVHAPVEVRWPRACNKLRGFQITPTAPRFLLLDTDVLVLKDLQPVADAVGDRIGLGPATFDPIPEAMWRRIFEVVSVPYPAEPRPYYNSGVVMGTWAHGLGVRWHAHLDRLLSSTSEAFWETVPRSARFADQYALATSVPAMSGSGVSVTTLPLPYHVRPPLLDAGVVGWADTALLHYPRVLRAYGETVQSIQAWLYGTRFRALRRRLAGRLGLRAIRAPALRGQPPVRQAWWEVFLGHVHGIVQEFGDLW
jgi:hypothetical protein